MPALNATNIVNNLKKLGSPEKAKSLQRFFKTGKGQYGHGDIFWGLTVPLVRKMAHAHKDIALEQLEKLLNHEVHEVRLCALLIMVAKSKQGGQQMYNLYLKNTRFINNWDLVDLSAPTVVGNFLLDKNGTMLYTLAKSPALWERRIAIVATHAFIKQQNPYHTLKLAELLMHDDHDLMHKAVGWMLREVGKRCSMDVLENFLETHAATMPRTMLRYAIERLQPDRKKYFMQAKYRLD